MILSKNLDVFGFSAFHFSGLTRFRTFFCLSKLVSLASLDIADSIATAAEKFSASYRHLQELHAQSEVAQPETSTPPGGLRTDNSETSKVLDQICKNTQLSKVRQTCTKNFSLFLRELRSRKSCRTKLLCLFNEPNNLF